MTNSPRQVRIMTVVILFAVYIAGIATGAAVVQLTRHPPFPMGMRGAGMMLPSLRGIDLDPEQRTRVEAIRSSYKQQIDAMLKDGFPKMRMLLQSMDHEVRDELRPDQQKQFDENLKDMPPFPPGGFGGPGMPFPPGGMGTPPPFPH